jgi:adenine specific DNA methylase Mod
MENVLYYGDNLDILRRYVKDESVDLIYLDPPFKSNQNYNVLFKEKDGSQAASQIQAFEDMWTWDPRTDVSKPPSTTKDVSTTASAARVGDLTEFALDHPGPLLTTTK